MAFFRFWSSALSALEGDACGLCSLPLSGAAPLLVSPLLCFPTFVQPVACKMYRNECQPDVKVSWSSMMVTNACTHVVRSDRLASSAYQMHCTAGQVPPATPDTHAAAIMRPDSHQGRYTGSIDMQMCCGRPS